MGTALKDIEIPQKDTYTIEDYKNLPEGAPYQLIRGEFITTPPPTVRHQEISKKLLDILFEMEKKGLGKVYNAPIGVYLNDEAFQPDIIFILKERLDIIKEDAIYGAPDIVIEILSPSTAYYDLRLKKDTYEKSGVREYWIVDPIKNFVEVYENKDGQFVLYRSAEIKGKVKSSIIKEFEVDVEWVMGKR